MRYLPGARLLRCLGCTWRGADLGRICCRICWICSSRDSCSRFLVAYSDIFAACAFLWAMRSARC
jgi:hypothetical protein